MLTMFRRKMYPGSSPSMRVRIPLVLAAVVALVGTSTPAEGDPLRLILPTRNDALLRGDGPSFYQYTHRTFEGRRSKPWQGGQYGFVRNPLRTAEGIIYTKFHEGVDIRPVYRDHRGEPADTVVSIDDGYVVYVNNYERQSSYGKYVVVEHWWGGSPFYSLYAHLNSVTVRRGQRIRQGEPIGKLGYTGRGIDRERAHLHFEINMLLNRNFGDWYAKHYRSSNRHDVFNGVNLAGLDVAGLYLALAHDPDLSIEEFVMSSEPAYAVAFPNGGDLDLMARYEWLIDWSARADQGEPVHSWEVTFTASGLPTRIIPSSHYVDEPELTMVRAAGVPYPYLTIGRVTGEGDRFHLSGSGQRYVSLLATQGDRERIVEFDHPPIRTVGAEKTSPLRLQAW